MKKKLLLLILALSLFLSAVSACAKDPADILNPEPKKTESETGSVDPSDPADPNESTDPVETGGETKTPNTTQPSSTTTQPTEPRVENPEDVEGTPSFNQGVMIMNDRIMELFGLNETGISNYSARINKLRDNLPATVTLYSMIVPTSSEFYTPADYHTGSHSQRTAINMIYDGLKDNIIPIDAYDQMLQHYEEYIYFKTDHHWTGLGAYYGYVAFCKDSGQEALPLSEYEEHDLGPFYGYLYSYGEGKAAIKADNVTVYRPKDYEASAWIYPDSVKSGGYQMHLLATTWNPDSNEKYMAFSGGDAPLMQITSGVKNGKKILVIKDSFAKALLPHLANNYEYVYEVDPRHFKGSVPQFVSSEGIDEVLVTNYALATANPTWTAGFDQIIQP